MKTVKKMFIDYGSGQHRKGLILSFVGLSVQDKDALIGFHTVTGNNFISALFKKGKLTCQKVMKKKPKFLAAFANLGSDWYLNDTFNDLEEFVCMLYGQKENKAVNTVRSKMFLQKYLSAAKVIDLVILSPYRSVLYLHARMANYIAKLWKSSHFVWLDMPNIEDHSWMVNGKIDWVDKIFLDDIEMLVDPNLDWNDIDSDNDEISDEEYEQ